MHRLWARLRPGNHHDYPASFQYQWLRAVERPNPDVPTMAGYIWIVMAGRAQQVQVEHFETVERTTERILVVDDDPSIRQTLHIALRNAGYEVLQARDGEEATRLWRESGPDLVIADIHMPRKSGLLLLQELQANGSSTRVIAMTDGGPARQFNLMGLAELLGAVRTIAKPFTLEQMVAMVKLELGTN
jgi:CheY-like chemotaxis protein